MAVKGKGKQVASDPPSGAKRWNGTAGAGPSSSSGAAKRRRRSGVLQFVDDVAGVDDEYEEEEEPESNDDLDDGFFTEEKTENVNPKRTERSHPLPFLGHVKEEELSGDELEEFVKDRYANRVKYTGYGGSTTTREHDDEFTMDGALKEPTIWRVKCVIGRERQMAFCFMQKFVDLRKFGTKVPVISAFALDHVRGFVFVEAEKACDVTEACKGFCNVYPSRTTSVPAAEVPSLLSSRAKPFEVSTGTWVRMKSGHYKGDLAQVISADDGRKRVMIKLIPRVDLQAISKKFGGAVSLKEAAVPAPRLISSQELEFFRPHIEMKRDRQTGDVFEVLDGLMFKDGFLYKRVALSSLIYWGIQPTETELLKFTSSPSNRSSVDDMDWVSSMYGPKKRNVPREPDMKASSSKEKCSKASNLKASTSTENYDDDEFNLHDLVLFGRKDFGVVIAIEKDGFKILRGGPEGSAVTVRKQDIKKGCVDKMFTAVDHQKKLISINDAVKVVEGPFQGKQGVVKHLYMGILFIYNESESVNNGFFCAQCGSCENIKKRKELASSEDNPISMFSASSGMPYEQNEQRDNERPYRSTREQLFAIGQMLRIRKGPLKGYLCRVVRIFRNDVTVKLDSLLKIVTVQAEFLSVPTQRGDNSSGAPSGPFGSQNTSFFGSEAKKTSWDNGLPSSGSDSWQPFSSSALPVQNTDGESEVDPWCKKPASSADDDSDPWGKKTTTPAVEVWTNSTTQKESSSDNAWDKQAGGGGLDGGGSTWDIAAVNKVSEKSDNWVEANKAVDMETGGDTDPWGSKVKEVDMKEADSWEKASVPPEKKLEDGSQGWGQPSGKSNQDCGTGGWGTAAADWSKSSAVRGGHEESWGKVKDSAAMSEEINNESGKWNKAGASDQVGRNDWDKPKFSGGDGPSSWNKGEVVGGDNQNNSWSKPGGNFEGGRGFGRGRGRGRGHEFGDSGGRNDQGSWKSSWGSDSSGRPPWKSDSQVDNEAGDSGGYRGRGRGRGQYGGRGRGGDNVWRNEDRGSSELEMSSGDAPNWGNSQPKVADGGCSSDWAKGGSNKDSWGSGDNWNAPNSSSSQPSTWNSSVDKKLSGGEQNDPWASKMATKGQEPQSNAWLSKMTSTTGAEDNSDGWKTKAKDSSCNTGGKLENAASGEEQQVDPWASKISSTKGKEQGTDPWESKVSSTVAADDNSNGWSTKAKDAPSSSESKWGNENKADAWNTKGGSENGGGWNNAGSSGGHQESSWGKPSFSSGDQEPAWSKPKYGDDNSGYGRCGFGRGNRGRGRGRYSGDNGSSWNGGSNQNDESGGERSGDRWNRRDFDGRGRGRGRFGRVDRNQGNNFGSGDQGGSSWGSDRGNRNQDCGYKNWNDNSERRPFSQDRGGVWSQPSDWSADKKGSSEGDQAFSKGKSGWGSDKNDSWGTPKPSGGDGLAGYAWSQNKPSVGDGSSILGQWCAPSGNTTTGGGSVGGGGSWLKSNEGDWNSSGGKAGSGMPTEKPSWGGSEAGPKNGGGSWEKGGGSGSQAGGGSSSWDKGDGGWNNGNKGGDAGNKDGW